MAIMENPFSYGSKICSGRFSENFTNIVFILDSMNIPRKPTRDVNTPPMIPRYTSVPRQDGNTISNSTQETSGNNVRPRHKADVKSS